MSVLTLGGRRFAAGLFWLERGGAVAVARNARRFGRPWRVHREGQTGYAPDEGGGCPSLAASLQAHLRSGFWMALVEGDDGRCALVKVRDGQVLADGDEVFEDRAAALEAFERARPLGWALYATPGLVEADLAGEIEVSALPDGPGLRLAPVPLARLAGGKAFGVLCLSIAVAGAGALWPHRDAVRDLLAGPPPVVETVRATVEPVVTASIDGPALIEACRRAMTRHPPWLPAWRTERVVCEARFSDEALLAVRPELRDRPVLTARWRLPPERSEALHRRVAEEHLAGWYAASVSGGRAWAVAPLDPVVRPSDAAPPPFLAFRRAVDRRLGGPDARIEYASVGGERREDGIEVRVGTGLPLARMAVLVGGVPGFEIVRLASDAAGAWRLEARRAAPVSMPRSLYERLTEEIER